MERTTPGALTYLKSSETLKIDLIFNKNNKPIPYNEFLFSLKIGMVLTGTIIYFIRQYRVLFDSR